jgi:hypothetical protein
MEHQRRVKFSVEVRSGAARFRMGVQTQSIREGLSLVGGRRPKEWSRWPLPKNRSDSSSTSGPTKWPPEGWEKGASKRSNFRLLVHRQAGKRSKDTKR